MLNGVQALHSKEPPPQLAPRKSGHGERSAARLTHRAGYRDSRRDTRVSTVQLLIPKLHQGHYFPEPLGWEVLAVWKCQIKEMDTAKLVDALTGFLDS